MPFSVASLDPCPAVPTPGDTVLVEIDLAFAGGVGGSGQLLSTNADGSWSGSVTFNFSGVGRKATISAQCLDFNGLSTAPYAQYVGHVTMLSS